jgi:hypothetical protein
VRWMCPPVARTRGGIGTSLVKRTIHSEPRKCPGRSLCRGPVRVYRAWKVNSAKLNFACTAFSELRGVRLGAGGVPRAGGGQDFRVHQARVDAH